MDKYQQLREALLKKAPHLEADFKKTVLLHFSRIEQRRGFVPSAVNAWDGDYKVISDILRPVCNYERMTGRMTINEEKLDARATTWAKSTAMQWFDKIVVKLGEVEEVRDNTIGYGTWVRVLATKAGRKVTMEQQMIVNVSPKGTLFNQFPARLYVDGKFTSEAQFKKLFA
jgi:hypothetical protein